MSRSFAVGPFPFGVVARLGAAFFAVIFVALGFFVVVFRDVAFLLTSVPERALDRSDRFRAWRKRDRWSLAMWHDLAGDQQTRGAAPARPRVAAPRPGPDRPGVRGRSQ
jgi:hypothetical protein